MSGTTVQWRGGSSAQISGFTGAAREAVVDTTKKTIVVQDGATAGGFPLLREDMSNVTAATGRTALGLATVAATGAYSDLSGKPSLATVATSGAFSDLTGTSATASANAGVKANASGVIDPSYLVNAPSDYRNLMINGDMSQWQRGTTFNAVANPSYTADRWALSYATVGSGVFNITQAADVPTIAQAGVAAVNSYKWTVGTAATGTGAGTLAHINQPIEAFNTGFLGFGAAGALSITLSFWVKSSVTGTYSAALTNSASNRCYPVNFSINSANTWEKKTVTIPGDTTGTWLAGTNGIGIRLLIVLHAGSTYQGSNAAWNSVAAGVGTSSNSNNFITTLSATFQLALVQLESGSVATPFEALPADVTLARCKRYYQTSYLPGTAPGSVVASGSGHVVQMSFGLAVSGGIAGSFVAFPAPMRSAPSLTTYDCAGTANVVTGLDNGGTPTNGVVYNAIYPGAVGHSIRLYASAYWGLAYAYAANSEL